MSKKIARLPWIPEIMYEDAEDGGISSHIPFIQVPTEEEMPKMLFVFESRETGEFEPGPEGEELPVTELDLHQYASMNYLKTRMSWVEYDNLRFSLGLEPLKTAAIKGAQITSNVKIAVEGSDKSALDNLKGDMENQAFKINLKKGGFENLDE